MKFILILLFIGNLAFSQTKYPNLGNDDAWILHPDSNLSAFMYKQGIKSYNPEKFNDSIVKHFGIFKESNYKTYSNIHTDEIDTIKVIESKGFKAFINQFPDKVLVYEMTITENFDFLPIKLDFNNTTILEITNLFDNKHVYAISDSTITFATFGDYSDQVIFSVNKNRIDSIKWIYTID